MSFRPDQSRRQRHQQRTLDELILKLLLYVYPPRFRARFGDELLAAFRLRRDRLPTGSLHCARLLSLTLGSWINAILQAPLAWSDEWRRQQPAEHRYSRPRPKESPMRHLLYEARIAARTLFSRQRSFSALCVLTLALGLSATTTIFSVVHGVLIAPLPYGNPEQIVRIFETRRHEGSGVFSGPNFSDLRARLTSFDVIAAYDDYRPEGIDLTGAEHPERLRMLRVGSGYFEALGVSPLLGRTFRPDEEVPPGAGQRDTESFAMITAPARPVVILSNGFWQRHYGGDPAVLGTRIELDLDPYTVIGVMPAGLGGHMGGAPDIWLPLDLAPGGLNVGYNCYLSVVGRLAPGVTVTTAQAELEQAAVALRKLQYNSEDLTFDIAPLAEVVVGPVRSMLGILLAAVAAMLGIACINVANLFLNRGLGRRRELGVRAALGAARFRLAAQALIESLWVATAGGVLGVAMAWCALRLLLAIRPEALPRYDALGLHLPVLVASTTAVLVTVLVCGLTPAIGAARIDGRHSIGAHSALSRSDRSGRRLRELGVSVQVALALVLLMVGGVLARSFLQLHGTDMGFDPENVLTFKLRLPDYAYADPDSRIAFYHQLLASLDATPELEASGAISKLPGTGHLNSWGFSIVGHELAEDEPYPTAEIRCVAGRALDALEVPVLRGRGLGSEHATGTEPVCLVNQALVDRYLADRDALGAQLGVGGCPRTIIGVVGNACHDSREATVPKIYLPQPQLAHDRNWDLSFVVAHQDDATWAAVGSQVAALIADLDPRLVMYEAAPLTELVAEPLARQRFGAQLMLSFAVLSLLLSAVGLFAALVYSVDQRRGEIGLRMALGADRGAVLRSVLRHGLRLCFAGMVLGGFGMLVARRWLESWLGSLLYGVRSDDPTALLLAAVVVLLVAAIAAAEPARRAARLDPAKILRES